MTSKAQQAAQTAAPRQALREQLAEVRAAIKRQPQSARATLSGRFSVR